MTLPLREVFFLTEVFFPVHADSSFVGASDMSPELTVTGVTIVTL